MLKHAAIRVLLTAAFSLLVIPNLGARTLWQDEAETALVAQVVEKRLLPYAYDDDGPISQDWNYQFSVSPLWRWHPWLQFYVAALFFKLFGISEFTGRLPFALAGIIFFWYFQNFLQRHGPKEKKFFWIAVMLTLTSVPLLLHIRQVRYYSLALLFTLMAVDGYIDILKRPDFKGRQGQTLKYLLGSILLFHSFLPGALALQVSFWIHQFVLLIRKKIKTKDIIYFAASFLITILFTLPWSWWLKIGSQNLNFSFELIKQNFRFHYMYIHKFIFPFFLLIPLASLKIRRKLLADENTILFSLIIVTNLMLYTINHPYFFRYLVPLIPFFAYIAARITVSLPKKIAVAAILIAFFPNFKLLPGYLFEITHPYFGTNEQLVKMFNSPSFSDAKHLAVNYDDFTFRFHTNLIVHGAQELPQMKICPDAIVLFPNWGNEGLLREIAERCGIGEVETDIPYTKLADDPNPVNHLFAPPTAGKLILFANSLVAQANSSQ